MGQWISKICGEVRRLNLTNVNRKIEHTNKKKKRNSYTFEVCRTNKNISNWLPKLISKVNYPNSLHFTLSPDSKTEIGRGSFVPTTVRGFKELVASFTF